LLSTVYGYGFRRCCDVRTVTNDGCRDAAETGRLDRLALCRRPAGSPSKCKETFGAGFDSLCARDVPKGPQ